MGLWGDGSWRVKRKKCVEPAQVDWDWKLVGCGGGRERTGAVGRPMDLSGRCVNTGSVKAESDLVVVVTVLGCC